MSNASRPRTPAQHPDRVTPCPDWCREPAGHPVDRELGRIHRRLVGPWVSLVQVETPAGELLPAGVVIDDDLEWTARQARVLAGVLEIAAETLEASA